MNTFQKLVSRGNAVAREWVDYSGLEPYQERMIAELAATGLVSAGGENIKNWSVETMKDKANFMKTLLVSAFQIGMNTKVQHKIKKDI